MVPGHLFLLFLPYPLIFGSMMRRPRRTSLRTSRPMAFNRNARSFCWISPTLHYPMSFELRDGNLSVCCLVVFIQEFYSNIHGIDTSVPQFATRFRGTCIVVTSDLVVEVLRVPKVAHPNYPSCDHLWTVFRDEPISHFCGTPSIWGGQLNTPCSGFARGPRFLNMVMTFTLTPLSHYNSITEPRAHFLLSLIKGLTIDFPYHFITSIIDVYQDIATRDKLIFPSVIM